MAVTLKAKDLFWCVVGKDRYVHGIEYLEEVPAFLYTVSHDVKEYEFSGDSNFSRIVDSFFQALEGKTCQEIEFDSDFEEIVRYRLSDKTIAEVKARIEAFNVALRATWEKENNG
jgi:hypothetical protein